LSTRKKSIRKKTKKKTYAKSEKASKPARARLRSGAKFIPFVSDESLMEWSSSGYVDSVSGERVYGKDILLRALYSSSFWVTFSDYVATLTDADLLAIGGSIPQSLGSFSPRIKKAGFEANHPKNMCLWLGALSPEKAAFCDEHGWLTGEGLKHWFDF
jgi:hypothetical protein